MKWGEPKKRAIFDGVQASRIVNTIRRQLDLSSDVALMRLTRSTVGSAYQWRTAGMGASDVLRVLQLTGWTWGELEVVAGAPGSSPPPLGRSLESEQGKATQ